MDMNPSLSRRGLLAAGGVALIGAASTGCTATSTSTGTNSMDASTNSLQATVNFDGEHQPGISTPAPLLTTFVGMDLLTAEISNLEAFLMLVSDDARRLMAGQPALADTEPENATEPGSLTIGIGMGRPLFGKLGWSIPDQLPPIPAFSVDALDPRWGQTDLVVQIGSDSPLALQHAQRMITKDVSTVARTVWVQEGFRGSLVGSTDASRNLMGQIDGTINPRTQADLDDVVWINEGPAWLRGGTVLVLRRIRMLLDTWDELDPEAKGIITGRHIHNGAPLGGEQETDPIDLGAVDGRGLPVIPANSHVAVAHQGGERILRRPFNYSIHEADGSTDAGQLFAAYMKNPAESFIPLQERISTLDSMNRWVQPIGSAAYLFPRGSQPESFIGAELFTG
jgi:dye decolorizing peroxidase